MTSCGRNSSTRRCRRRISSGSTIPDPALRFDEASGHWRFGAIDWEEFRHVLAGNGPCNRERLAARRQRARGGRLGARGGAGACAQAARSRLRRHDDGETPLWEVFIRSRNGLAHKHVGSVHAADATMALQAARDVYTRRGEGLSIWVVPSAAITASRPGGQGDAVRAGGVKIYRHPTFYEVPDEVGHM